MNTKPSEGELPNSPETIALRVTGRVGNPLMLGMTDIRDMESEEFQDLFIVCGTGTPKDCIQRCRGVLIEKIIQKADVLKEGHNDTKKMFIVATADDGYKVVFSWQEIFNTAIGGGVAVLTERDGLPLGETRDRIDLISSQDYYAGSRYVRDLRYIEVLLFQ
ncbi:MAG: sulfite oxidase-like oxidoreductase [Deltaproteobacteria bacterium]|nr:sulfite oxidase-like oxidoreductase [Deltaproteobacteria bacterium]